MTQAQEILQWNMFTSKEPNEYKKRAIEKIKLLNKSLEGHTINENNSSP